MPTTLCVTALFGQELEWLFSDAKSPRGKPEPDRGEQDIQ